MIVVQRMKKYYKLSKEGKSPSSESSAPKLGLARAQARKVELKEKAFCRLMFLGKIGQASKFIINEDCVKGFHKITEDVKQALAEKHPKAEEPYPDVLLPVDRPIPNPVIFEQITADTIQQCSKDLNGSGAPTLIDADIWKHFICSRSYGNHPHHLAEAISGLAKRLCTEQIHPDSLHEYTACCLIP